MSETFEHDTHPRARHAASADPSRARVLIIDDDEHSRHVCVSYCDLFDHASHGAKNAQEAVDALRREPFDVVVLSVHMSGGLDALRAIRALPDPAGRAPVIGLAGVGRGDESQRWLAAGLAAVLPKPVTARRLFGALTDVIAAAADGPRSWAPAV